MNNATITELREILSAIAKDADEYFDSAAQVMHKDDGKFFDPRFEEDTYYWSQLTEDLRDTADALVGRLLPPCAVIAEATRSSPLTGSEDLRDVKIATKTMRAALLLRRYYYYKADVAHDEGTVLGFIPAEQSEKHCLSPNPAKPEIIKEMALEIRKDCCETKLFGDERHAKIYRKAPAKDYGYYIDL